MSEAIFSDVIDVSFDTAGLEQSLTEFIALYRSKMEELSSINPGSEQFANFVNVSAITTDLNQVREEIGTLVQAFVEGFAQVAAASGDTGQQVASNIKSGLDKTDADVAVSSKRNLEALSLVASSGSEAWDKFATAAQTALDSKLNPAVGTTKQLQANLFEFISRGGEDAFAKLDAYQQQFYVKYNETIQKQIQTVNKAYDEDAARQNQSYEQQLVIGNEIVALTARQRQEQVLLGDEIVAAMRRAQVEQEKLAQDSLALIQRQRTEQEALGTAIVAIINRERQEQIALGNETLAILSRERQEQVALGDAIVAITRRTAQEKLDAEKQAERVINDERRAQEELGNAIIAILRRERQEEEEKGNAIIAINKRVAAEAAAAAKGNKGGSAEGAGLFGNLGEQIKSLAIFQLEFTAINDAIELATRSVGAFFDFLKNGLTYLEDIETRSAALQGILATNVEYSKDFATNLKIAGQAAEGITAQIQNASIKYGITIDILTRSFKSFVDSGGVSLVKNTQEALDTSNLLSVSIKGAGKDTETTRAALSEIPKLLDGTITNTSTILKTLGLSTVEWKAMREEAKNQQNLLEQLTSRLEAFRKVAEDSGDRFGAIKESLGLIYDRTAGLAAQEFWPTLKADLKIIRDFLLENKDQIYACAKAIGDFVSDALKLSDVKAAMGTLLLLFRNFAVQLILIKQLLSEINALMGFVVKVTEAASSFSLSGIKQHWEEAKAQLEDYTRAAVIAQGEIYRLDHPTAVPKGALPENIGGKDVSDNAKVKLTGEALTELKRLYKDQETELHKSAEKEREDIDLSLAARKISAQTASQLISQVNQKEYEEQLKLIISTKSIGDAYAGIPPKAKAAFDATMIQDLSNLNLKKQKQDYDNQKKALEDQLKLQDQNYAQQEAALTKFQTAEVAKLQAYAKSGALLASDADKQEIAIVQDTYNKRVVILNEEYRSAGKNAELQDAVYGKLLNAAEVYTAGVSALSARRNADLLTEAVALGNFRDEVDRAQYAKAKADIDKKDSSAGASSLEQEVNAQKLAIIYKNMIGDLLTRNELELEYARSLGLTTSLTEDQQKKLQALVKEHEKLEGEAAKADDDVKSTADKLGESDPITKALDGAYKNFKDTFENFNGNSKDFAVSFAATAQSLTTTITLFSQAGAKLAEDISKGNVLGAVGDASGIAGGIVGSMKDLFKSAPIIGGVLESVGPLLGAISSIFTAAARRIAEDIKTAFDKSVQAYQQGSATLQATLAAVEQERADAISQLSGKKGGQDQLNQLLPTIDNEINQLKTQQTQIITNFDTSLQKLKLGSDVLSQTLDTWTQINASVKEYIDAGGDAAEAQQYLSLSLQKLQEDAATNLASGENDAIQKAITLNDLLTQRQTLIDDYNKSRFDTLNADALERRASNAVSVGLTQSAADAAYQKSLADLNQQIATAQTEVNMYSQIYSIASDTATLKAESSALEIANLATTIQKLKDYQNVYSSIYQTPTGYATNNGAGSSATTTTNAITVAALNLTINTTGQIDAGATASAIQTALTNRGRYGAGTIVQSGYS